MAVFKVIQASIHFYMHNHGVFVNLFMENSYPAFLSQLEHCMD